MIKKIKNIAVTLVAFINQLKPSLKALSKKAMSRTVISGFFSKVPYEKEVTKRQYVFWVAEMIIKEVAESIVS